MGILDRLFRGKESEQRSVSLKSGEDIANLLGLDLSAVPTNGVSAMSISTFFSCVRLISDLLATQPCSLFEEVGSGAKIAKKKRLHYLLHNRANARMSSFIFRRTMFANMLVYGRAIARIIKDEYGEPIALIPYPTKKVNFVEDNLTGNTFFQINDGSGSQGTILFEDEVIYLKDLSFDGNKGKSIVDWQYNTLKLDLLVEKYSREFYEKGTFMAGFLETQIDPKNKELAKAYKDNIVEALQGSSTGGRGFAVLGSGVKWHSVGQSPVENQVIAFLDRSDKDIAKFFGVPLTMLGDTEKQTSFGTGIDSMFIQLVNTVLMPKAVQFEQEVNYKCILFEEQDKYYSKINFRNLLRGDAKTYAEFVRSMIQNGVYNQNEVRAWEEMEAVEGGDQNWIQQNMMPIKDAKEILTSKVKTNGTGQEVFTSDN